MTEEILKRNLEEVIKASDYNIQYNRDLILFSMIDIRYRKDFLLGVKPELDDGKLKATLEKIKKRELSLISGVILILDKYDALGHEHRCNMDYSADDKSFNQESIEHVRMLIEDKYNPKFYKKLEEIFERSEGADWIIGDRHFGYGTIKGVIEAYESDFRHKNIKIKDENSIKKFYENEKIMAENWEIIKSYLTRKESKEKNEKIDSFLAEIKIIEKEQEQLLGTLKEEMQRYLGASVDLEKVGTRLENAFSAAKHANDENCYVYHASQTPKKTAYLGGMLEIGKNGVERKVKSDLDIDGKIAAIDKGKFIFPQTKGIKNIDGKETNGLYMVLEEYMLKENEEKGPHTILKAKYLIDPLLVQRVINCKIYDNRIML